MGSSYPLGKRNAVSAFLDYILTVLKTVLLAGNTLFASAAA